MAGIVAPPSAPHLRGLHRSQFHLQSKMTLLLSLVRCHLSKPSYDVGCSLRRQRSLTYVCGTLGLRHFLLSKARTSLPARVGQRYELEALTITAAAQISIHEFKDTPWRIVSYVIRSAHVHTAETKDLVKCNAWVRLRACVVYCFQTGRLGCKISAPMRWPGTPGRRDVTCHRCHHRWRR